MRLPHRRESSPDDNVIALAAVADHVEGVGEGLAAVAAPRVLTPLGRRPLAFPPHRLRA